MLFCLPPKKNLEQFLNNQLKTFSNALAHCHIRITHQKVYLRLVLPILEYLLSPLSNPMNVNTIYQVWLIQSGVLYKVISSKFIKRKSIQIKISFMETCGLFFSVFVFLFVFLTLILLVNKMYLKNGRQKEKCIS